MNSPPTLPPHVFRLLSRQYNLVPWSSNHTLGAILTTIRQEHQNALVEMESQGRPLGRLLFQTGRLVYTQQSEVQGRAALLDFQQDAFCRSRVLPLDTEQATLAFAAVDGTPCTSDAFRSSGLGTYVRELTRQAFEGVLAVEHGRQLTILCFDRDRELDSAPLEILRVIRLTQIAWRERVLDELKDSKSANAAGEPPISSKTVVSEQVSSPPSAVPEYDLERVWALFETVMGVQLGERAPRLVATTRASLARDRRPEPLTVQLARQVERVAGSTAAHDFVARCAPYLTLPTPS